MQTILIFRDRVDFVRKYKDGMHPLQRTDTDYFPHRFCRFVSVYVQVTHEECAIEAAAERMVFQRSPHHHHHSAPLR